MAHADIGVSDDNLRGPLYPRPKQVGEGHAFLVLSECPSRGSAGLAAFTSATTGAASTAGIMAASEGRFRRLLRLLIPSGALVVVLRIFRFLECRDADLATVTRSEGVDREQSGS